MKICFYIGWILILPLVIFCAFSDYFKDKGKSLNEHMNFNFKCWMKCKP